MGIKITKSFADIVFAELSGRGLTLFPFEGSVAENSAVLEDLLAELNITKCTLQDIDSEYPGATLHLRYLLQTKGGINFGLCEHLKMWQNKEGWQYRCFFDQGTRRSIPVNCLGSYAVCEREEQRLSYEAKLQRGLT